MKPNGKREALVLVLILILAAFLRFWQLEKVPPSPSWDEAALGYNAYSLMKTGKDEYGQPWPLILRSFDDYKPAIYAYLAILPIKLFGLNVFSVRFPSAFFGVLTVLVAYLLFKELLGKNQISKHDFLNSIPLVATFLLAVSPWHLQFSRVAFESNLGVFFNTLVAYFFLKGLKKPWFLVLAAFFAGLNLYTYQAEKVFGPPLVLFLVLVWRRQLLKTRRRYLVLALGVGFLLSFPLVRMALTTPDVFLRAKGTSFAADLTPFLARTVEKLIRDHQHGDWLGVVLDNRRMTYFFAFMNSYLSHFDFNWLFVSGDDVRHHAPEMGLLYLWELPFLLLGIYRFAFGDIRREIKLVIFGWFFLAPFPAAFTSGVPHAIRAQRFLPVIQFLVALGIVSGWQLVKKKGKFLKASLVVFGGMLFVFNFVYYLNQYLVQQSYFTSQSWQYGYQEATEEIKKTEGGYKKIVVSNEPYLDQSYIFFLFYLQYNPKAYQKSGGTVSGGFAETHQFAKFIFRPIDWDREEKSEGILYVGMPSDFHQSANVLKKISFLNGEEAIYVVQGR